LRTRFLLLAIALILGFTSLLLRCWQLQIQSEGLFEDKALKNQLRTFPIPAKRGEILDRNGEVIAGNRSAYRIKLLDPSLPVTHEQLAFLGSILGGTVAELRKKILTNRGEYFYPVTLGEDIGRRSSTILLENKVYLPNIVIEEGPVRYYPFEALACHVLGYMGRISSDELQTYEQRGYPRDASIGRAGLERVHEENLRGRDGLKTVQVDALGWPHDERVSYPPQSGCTLQLTIDLEFQMAAERAIEGRNGAMVILDTANGDVLAMASYPTFDPNLFTHFVPASEWRRLRDKRRTPLINRAIEGEYQPGSTFKVISGYAALVSGILTPEAAIVCNGSFTLGKRVAYCWKPHGHGSVSFEKAVGQSCNVYFYSIGAEIDVERLAEVSTGFGLGHKTGIGLPNERPGIVPDKTWREQRRRVNHAPWTRGDTVNAAIGQGDMLVTPLQMARAIAAVSNGGKVFVPRLVTAVVGPDGAVVDAVEPVLEHDLNMAPDVLEPLREGLRQAVQSGTAQRARMKNVTVFGKTGSAQNPGRKTHAWFVGVMETRRPSVALAVLLEGAGAGGTEAVPAAREAFETIRAIIDRRHPMSPPSVPATVSPASASPAVVTTSVTAGEVSTDEAPYPPETDGSSDDAFMIGIDPDETFEYGAGDDALYRDDVPEELAPLPDEEPPPSGDDTAE